MRAAIYARYSSDLQRDDSIEDQVRICRARIEKEGWQIGGTYTDHAISGASRFRPGYQKLMEDARAHVFDVVVAEALDRLSRDQEDVAGLYKRLNFSGVKIVTISEGEITELHVGLKGAMNALFLKDLAQKIRRGLEGRVRKGKSGGGLGYGYEVIRAFDAGGEPVRGNLVINDAKAAIVRRIFKEYAIGCSPRAIAGALNKEDLPGPSGKPWGPSTIYGNWRRGTGILNNELYVGRRVWNRQKFIKDPVTGNRVTRYNPAEALVIENVPDLRIVSDDLWDEVKKRQRETRHTISHGKAGIRSERARRPAYLLSGLLHCGVCGGGFSKRNDTHYACSTAHDRGTCTNLLRIRRDVLEASVLSGLKTHLMRPELVREFIAEYNHELDRLTASNDLDGRQRAQELARIDREIRAIIDAIKAGFRTASMQSELLTLEGDREKLLKAIKAKQPKLVRLHPSLDQIYRKKIARLEENLNEESVRIEAAEGLRGLIREIRLIPEEGELQIELVGDITSILAFSNESPRQASSAGALITLVAGERYHLYRTTLIWSPRPK